MTTTRDSCTRKSRGRPKVFDRDAALDKAMTLFWQHGYEATSMAHLVEATGAKAPTLYAEFTNKEGLFRAVLDRYIAEFASRNEAQLLCENKTVYQALADYFSAVAHCFTSKDTPSGCFIICTSSALAASNEDIANTIKERHAQQAQIILEFLTMHQQRGAIPDNCNLQALTDYLCCILQGMSVSAREGASYEDLMKITATTLRLWPELIKA
ncbi:TetR/AcrR family transcriptional regulator [Shimwellia blattae]|uniref:Putative HTH-type transcriptional regulator n=1 Tax=Shimwellia blattae (strain ATCC 29907 / DSM 4481 / JCM 1650 / NBRC 105725 / CDC 9005-74) TaxID=630626 RepID=I2BAC5_SHIBC|nr:TetR/AcrR family transcriptional regulator [Shimwellia blattae]AFJ47479.1 putative HTH-type transcriptional regulator [Shimwellia blattae DSM 4481 = NBRC 105725]GAB80330.1 putative TetR family transcriptional regulator YcfQ [Shimwellia blattae DSM 4481 = NBRC 105725]VDY64976.1 Bacterial regulatory proteins, tetR family [Shimwellia blattae]VEC23252.1 Bacterial regulatory proteins, tetR family [Shimwellia blattae]